MIKAILGFLAMLVTAGPAAAAGIEGYWAGTALRGGEERPIAIQVDRLNDGLVAHYDIPSLSLEGMPLDKFRYDPAS